MNTLDAIMTRRSVRKFTDQEISDEELKTILKAAMAAPSAVNKRDWSFIVVRDPETLKKMADGNGAAAQLLKGAKLGILVCADHERVLERAPEFWIINCAIACENMILAAKDLGIGTCWLGTYPGDERVNAQREIFDLPENITPHSIIAFGYPAEDPARRSPEWEEDRVHYEKW